MSVEALRGLADPTRRRIVERLSSGGLAVSEIAADLPMSRPAVSKHLRVLREHGLVVETKVGRRRIYELVARPLEEMIAWLEVLSEAEGTRRGVDAATPRTGTLAAPAGDRERPPARSGPERPRRTAVEDEDDGRWRSW